MPAFDALNIAMNEGAAAKDQDIALCFAGDLRNVIKTINGLPSDYTGKCTLVINDFHPLVAIRSIVLLCILLDPSGPSEEVAAEVALHALYSSKLTTAQHTFLHTLIKRIEGLEREREVELAGQLALGSHCTLKWTYPPEVGALLTSIRAATYPMGKAETNRRRIMLAPSRIDYRDRYYTPLRCRHRAGFAHQRETGVLLPIGQPIDSFSTVNRLLYSEDGDWLLKDNANPASAWAPLEVEATRQKLDLPEEDYIGSLFFHIKDQLAEFAGRARRFNMEIVLSAIDLRALPDLLEIMGMDDIRFDRVETSNVMDTLGPAEIISTWGPYLNPRNPCSTLLMYSMNWAFHVPGGRADGQGPNGVMDTMAELIDYLGIEGEAKPAKPLPISLLSNNLGAFFDTRPPFQRYLHQNGVTIASRLFGVQERKEPRILPARFGVDISEFDSPKITITREQFYFSSWYPDAHFFIIELTPSARHKATFSFHLGMNDL
ncbi:hypothetical protein FRC00_002368 [Tulasnella sp. 408]|nr:hypothetical protein FRC00_002368 [Tulasnella sp. 408]